MANLKPNICKGFETPGGGCLLVMNGEVLSEVKQRCEAHANIPDDLLFSVIKDESGRRSHIKEKIGKLVVEEKLRIFPSNPEPYLELIGLVTGINNPKEAMANTVSISVVADFDDDRNLIVECPSELNKTVLEDEIAKLNVEGVDFSKVIVNV